MFEQIVLRRAESGASISAGQLAEAMLYYQRVHMVIDRGTLSNLVKQIGTEGLLAVLARDDVSAVYCDEMLGTHTESTAASQYHNYVAINLAGGSDGEILKSVEARLRFDLKRDGLSSTQAHKFTAKFLNYVPPRTYSGDSFVKGGIPKAATEDLRDANFVLEAVRRALSATEGGLPVPTDLKFDILESDLGGFVFTNIDFTEINNRRARQSPPVEPLTAAHLISNILEARADLALASYYGGDFVTSSTTSSIIQVRHAEILKRSGLNFDSRQQFSEIVLGDMPCLSETIDSGERTFDDFLKLIDQATKFKKWLKSVSPDENLVREYLREVSEEGWLNKLHGKSIRYMLTTAASAVNPIAGIVAGFADTFLADKISRGWKPNHFISSKLAPFVSKN